MGYSEATRIGLAAVLGILAAEGDLEVSAAAVQVAAERAEAGKYEAA